MQELVKALSRREENPQGTKELLLLKNCIFFFNPGESEGDSSINQSIQDGKTRWPDEQRHGFVSSNSDINDTGRKKKSHLHCFVECNCVFFLRLPPSCRRTRFRPSVTHAEMDDSCQPLTDADGNNMLGVISQSGGYREIKAGGAHE